MGAATVVLPSTMSGTGMNSANVKTCLACGGQLETGFLVDGVHGGAATVARWVSGVPVLNRFGALKGRALRDRRTLGTTSLRCANCGRLEFYAASGDS